MSRTTRMAAAGKMLLGEVGGKGDSGDPTDGGLDTKVHTQRRLQQYHDALLRGRHPRSFPMRSNLFWQTLGDAAGRLKRVQSGQCLASIVPHMTKEMPKSIPVGDKLAPLPSLSEEINEISKNEVSTSSVRRPRTSRSERSSVSDFSMNRRSVTSSKRTKNTAQHLKETLGNIRGAIKSQQKQTQVKVDFNNLRGVKVFYGSKVAFEQQSLQGPSLWLTLTPSGKFVVAPRDSEEGQFVFKLINLANQVDQRPVRFGEKCWIGISTGLGDKWQQGSVMGSKMKHAVNLIEDTHADDEALGIIVPVPAYVPADNRMNRQDHNDRLMRNKLPLTVGKWKLQPALRAEQHLQIAKTDHDAETHLGGDAGKQGSSHNGAAQVFNLVQVYLEQDWFFIASDDRHTANKGGPGSSSKSKNQTNRPPVVMRKLTNTDDAGKFLVSACGIFTLHVVEGEAVATGSGHKSSAKKVENLLYQARMQLHNSKSQREGSKSYSDRLQGGGKFAVQIRRLRQSGDETQERQFHSKQDQESRRHFTDRRSSQSVHRHFERVLESHLRRTKITSTKWKTQMDRTTTVVGGASHWHHHHGHNNAGPAIAEKDHSRSRHRIGTGEWYRRMCGTDLMEVDEEVERSRAAVAEDDEDSHLGGATAQKNRTLRAAMRLRKLTEDNDNEPGPDQLPIYQKLLTEDERTVNILQYRQANAAFVDLYTSMFSDIEW